MMEILRLDGREYHELAITSYEIELKTLDGEGTGRAKAYGWPLIRDPEGSILNFYFEFARTNSKNPDFIHLWNTCKKMGREEFVPAMFLDPIGDIIEHNVYLVVARLKNKRFEQDGTIYTDVIKVNFIAERGF